MVFLLGCGKHETAAPANPSQDTGASSGVPGMPTTFWGLYDHFAISSFDKQLGLVARHAPEQGWKYTKSLGQIVFVEDSASYAVQVLGIEDHIKHVWRWGWADPISNFPKESLAAAESLRQYGRKHKIPELTKGELPTLDVKGEWVAILASGFCQAQAYYPAGFPGQGIVYFLVMDDRLKLGQDCTLQHASTVVPRALEGCNIRDERAAIGAYFRQCGYTVEAKDGGLSIGQGSSQLNASFDRMKRLVGLEGTIPGK